MTTYRPKTTKRNLTLPKKQQVKVKTTRKKGCHLNDHLVEQDELPTKSYH